MRKIEILEIAGIYAIHIINDDTWYIGESNDILARLHQHRKVTFVGKNLEFFVLEDMPKSSKSERLKIEMSWHQKLSGKYHLVSTACAYENLDSSVARRKLSMKDAEWIREHYKPHDKTYGQLPMSKRFNISRSVIWNIVNHHTYIAD